MDRVHLGISGLSHVLAEQRLWQLAVLSLLLVGAAWLLLGRGRDADGSTQVPGLPLIGNAMGLGRHGVAYINKCRQKFGDTFSLSLAGVKMTFLFEPAHIDYFFAAPDEKVTFRPAVEQFTQRVFGLTSRLFFPLHFKMLTELRHLLVPSALAEHMQLLGTRALQLLPCYVHHSQVDLYSLCRGLVFHCAVEAVFGRPFVVELEELMQLGRRQRGHQDGEQGHGSEENEEEEEEEEEHEADVADGPASASAWAWALGMPPEGQRWAPPRPPAGVERLARTFFAFEEGFELAASPVPHAFQPEFVRSRAELLRLFKAADKRGLFQGTLAGQLLDRTTGLPPHLRPNLLLAVMWASQANTVPAVFWSTAFLLLPENLSHKTAVLAELQGELWSTAPTPGPASTPGPAYAGAAGGSAGVSAAPGVTRDHQPQPSASELVAAATRLASSRRSAVGRCVAEALRLRVQSIDVRQASAPLNLPAESAPGGRLHLPRGRLLAVCPFESHHDSKLFCSGEGAADPWVYDPHRPELRLGDGGAMVPSVAGLAFGGGPYRCPGRFFAEQELGMLVQLLLWSYDMQLSYGDAASRCTTSATAPSAAAIPLAPGPAPPGEQPSAQAAHSAAPSKRTAPTQVALDVPPQPQLLAVQGGSLLYAAVARLVGPSALVWGCGWFDGLDGPIQNWRHSGDPAGLLPPCDLRRLVGVKVPRKPCWVQLGWPARVSSTVRLSSQPHV